MKKLCSTIGILILVTACSYEKQKEESAMEHMDHGSMQMASAANAGWSLDDESQAGNISFVIKKEGEPWKEFDIQHEKRMHLIVVRSDLTNFQHLHPTMKSDGTWTVPFTPPVEGTYWIYADFVATNAGDHVVRFEKTYGKRTRESYIPQKVVTPSGMHGIVQEIDHIIVSVDMKEIDSLQTSQEKSVRMKIHLMGPMGDDVTVEPYLGANGHSVWISPEGDYIHAHPDENYEGFKKGDAPMFMIHDLHDERYRTFTQFKVHGVVRTAIFDWPFPQR